jgi:hypothetical protein
MNSRLIAALAACGLAACATTSSGPVTSWGKEGVSMLDYQADGIYCAAATESSQGGNGANTAGGINGSNSSQPATPTVATGPGTGGASGAATPIGGGGMYREGASNDFVNRAAMQQRQAEMQRLKARQAAMHSCLVNRGYTEFKLTEEQRQHLATLPEGSPERRAYLYKLGTDPSVLKSNKVSGS